MTGDAKPARVGLTQNRRSGRFSARGIDLGPGW
jgi:hypothetical protein